MFLNYQCQLSPLKWHDTNNKITNFLNFGHYSYSWNWTNNPDSFSTILVMLSCVFHFGIVFTLHVKWDPDFNTGNHINKVASWVTERFKPYEQKKIQWNFKISKQVVKCERQDHPLKWKVIRFSTKRKRSKYWIFQVLRKLSQVLNFKYFVERC